MILAGDVGGTKIHLAIYEADRPTIRVREEVFGTAAVESLVQVVRQFISSCDAEPRAAAFGVAGPVVNDAVTGTNLPWPVDVRSLSAALGGIPVRLVNDLEASGHAIDSLAPNEMVSLQEGVLRGGARVLVSPGTGLGEALLVPHADTWIPVAGEGGHADFSPRTAEEWELHTYLAEAFGRVSCERVVSGPGLVNVYCWLRDRGGCADDLEVDATPGESAPAAVIGAAAVEGSSGIAREAVRIWSSALGAEAGNAALRGLALGGVYLGGGIPVRLLNCLRERWFLDAFHDKTPHRELLEQVPVHVITVDDTSVRGAARLAVEASGAA